MSKVLEAIKDQSVELYEKEQKLLAEVNEFCEEVAQNRKLFVLAGGDVADLDGLGSALQPRETPPAPIRTGGAKQTWFPCGEYLNMRISDACSKAFKKNGKMSLALLAEEIFGYGYQTKKNWAARRRLSVVMSEKRNGRKLFVRTPGTRIWDNR